VLISFRSVLSSTARTALIRSLGESVLLVIRCSLEFTSLMIWYCLPALKSILPATIIHISLSMSGLMLPLMLLAVVIFVWACARNSGSARA
jgi:hypothetical protein